VLGFRISAIATSTSSAVCCEKRDRDFGRLSASVSIVRKEVGRTGVLSGGWVLASPGSSELWSVVLASMFRGRSVVARGVT